MKLAVMAVSLGGVETLVEHPASTTHNDKCVPREVKIASGITDGLLRLRSYEHLVNHRTFVPFSECVCVIYKPIRVARMSGSLLIHNSTYCLGLW